MVMKNLFKLNKISLRAQKYIFILFIIVLSVGLLEALILSPADYKQSESVRIMYVHVPSAWTSVGIFSLIAFLSIIFLKIIIDSRIGYTRMPNLLNSFMVF